MGRRELFGVEDLYKDSGKSKDLRNHKEIFLRGDEKMGVIENKFMKDEPISDEEFKEAEDAIKEVTSLINEQIDMHKELLCEKVTGAPQELISIFIDSSVHDMITLSATLAYKRAMLKIIRQKCNKKGSIKLDAQDKIEEKEE